jgi:hypothetical protein
VERRCQVGRSLSSGMMMGNGDFRQSIYFEFAARFLSRSSCKLHHNSTSIVKSWRQEGSGVKVDLKGRI